MIEAEIRTFLESTLDVPVYLVEPSDKPSVYVTIERTGASIEEHLETTTITIMTYAPSMAEAAKLSEKVKQAMLYEAYTLDSVSGVRLNTEYNYPDIETKRNRYYSVFLITNY